MFSWLFLSHFGLSNKYLLISLLSLTFSMIIPNTFMISNAENATVTENSQTNINANSLYNNRTMILGNNVKNFVIIIPDEAHESLIQPKNQLPLTNQPYFPQHLVTNVGTTIVWFNADVGHKHMVTLTDSNSKKVYEAAFFPSNEASKPLTLNTTGDYSYYEKSVNKDVPNYMMNGTITVTNLKLTELKAPQNASSQNKVVITGAYMIPAIMLDKYVSEFTKRGFVIDSHFTYKDLRGGQKGTGPEQTLITWTTPNTNLERVISALKEITPTLPYS
jgi:plastocyanin